NAPFDVSIASSHSTSSTFDISGTTFVQGTGTFNSTDTIDSILFVGGNGITHNNAIMTNCTFDNIGRTAGYIVLTTGHKISDSTFKAGAAGHHALEITTAGTYGLQNVTLTGFTASLNPTHTTGTVTVNVSGGTIPTVDSSWTSNGSGNYTKGNATTQINASAIINVTGLVAGSSVRVFSTGSSTIIASDENSATTEQFTVNAAAVDITVLKAGQIPFRITNVSTSSGTVNIQPNQTEDRAYAASSGLAFGSSCTI
ncbi:MAG: hypothetical protein GY928_09585, partial [Colwellia sp.]|nr:hypothetical protein [Colwellia sp.]